MIAAADFARVHKIPYLGLCYGMQLAVVAFARSVLGWTDANTTENAPLTKHPVIHLIPGQENILKTGSYGGSMRLGGWEASIKKGTKAWEIYRSTYASERHRHRWEFNNVYADDFETNGLIISARSVKENLVEMIELPGSIHPFYIGVQGHPEYKSSPWKPHPVFTAFLRSLT